MTLPSFYSSLLLKEQPATVESQSDHSDPPEPCYQSDFWSRVFPEYNFQELITETQSSLVWRGVPALGGRRLALKVTERVEAGTSQGVHQNSEKTFLESMRLGRMVNIKEIREKDDFRLVVMEYYPWSLDDLLKQFVRNSNRRNTQSHIQFILYAFQEMAKAVNQLHALGYVHRDLKLDNFMVDQNFKVYLNDFQLVTKELETDSSLSGTLEYMAPERLSKQRGSLPLNKSVDIWSLGIILFELFTGQTPFNGDSPEQILNDIYSIYAQSKQIPAKMMKLIQGMLQIRPQNRSSLQDILGSSIFQREININFLGKLMHN